MIPRYVFFTKGIGRAKNELQSFEAALRKAGISALNLVQVSSIIPPNCKEISPEEGFSKLSPGQIVFVVLARHSSNEKNRSIFASIGVAQPKDENHYGYLSEHHSFGQDEEVAGDFTEDLAASMLASTLGIPFDPDEDYDTRREIFRMSDKIVNTISYTQMGVVENDGEYTTVISVAVFII